MNPKNGLIIFLLFLLFSPQLARAQDVDDDEAVARKKVISERVHEELGKIFRTKAHLTIDDLERFLDFEHGHLKKSRILAKGSAQKIARRFGTTFVDQLVRHVKDTTGATYSVNGTKYTFEGEEETETPFLKIELDLSNRFARWSVRYSNRSTSGATSSQDLPFHIEKTKGWRKSVSEISDEQIAEFEKYRETRRTGNVHLALTSKFAADLRLDEEQREKMNQWLSGKITFDLEKPIIENIKINLTSNKLFDSTPDFLSDAQQAKWKLIGSNPHPMGW